MMQDIIQDIKQNFKQGNIVTKLIYVNLGIFVLVNLVFVFMLLFNVKGYDFLTLKAVFTSKFLSYLMVPANVGKLLYKPWSLLTYMFLHFNFWHVLFNLIWLYIFGRIFLLYLTEKQLFSTYILGGLAGAALYIISYNLFPGLVLYADISQMLGASAAVMAIAMSISFYVPNYSINLIFLGPVKLKYIAIFFIVTDILQIASYNAGGHIAHLGGVLYALIYIRFIRQGKDLGSGINRIADSLVTLFKPRKSKLKVSYKKSAKEMDDFEYNRNKAAEQKEIDRILDKIAKSGYDSLSKKEKEILFRMSNRKS